MNKSEIRLSKFISLILRHKPEVIGIRLDEQGYASVQELIEGIRRTGMNIDFGLLKKIVDEDEKQRYSFSEDFTKIRANYGHSVKVDLGLTPATPPDILYHGTSQDRLPSILKHGVKRMSREYVHLSSDVETAVAVGKRHGRPVVLYIDAKKMHDDGFQFYLSKSGVWLTRNVPSKYIQFARSQ